MTIETGLRPQAVRRHGPRPDCPRSRRARYRCGSRPRGMRPQRLPHRLLKRGAAHVERQIVIAIRRTPPPRRREPRASASAASPGTISAAGKRARSALASSSNETRHRPRVGRCDEHRAKAGVDDGPADRLPRAAIGPGARRHAQPPGAVRVEAARRGIAGFVDRVGHVALLRQGFGGARAAQAAGIGCGGHAGRALEQPVEMVRRIADPRRKRVEPDRRVLRRQQRERLRHRDAVAPDLVGLAAQAGAKPGGARGRRDRHGRRRSRAWGAAPGSSACNRCRWS